MGKADLFCSLGFLSTLDPNADIRWAGELLERTSHQPFGGAIGEPDTASSLTWPFGAGAMSIGTHAMI
jgi:hypothetical protein